MKKLCTIVGLGVLVGCANFANNLYRTEQLAVGAAYTEYVGYTNGLSTGLIKVSTSESNSIKEARLDFAASVGVFDAFRLSYETNSTAQGKAQAQAALDSVLANSSNLVWLIRRIERK